MAISKFNKGELVFKDTERFNEFKTLEQLFNENGLDKQYIVKGVYSFKSSYGEGCFIKSDGFNISLPTHLLNTIKEIREDKESIDAINDGRVYTTIYSYTLPEKYPNKVFYSVNFIEK